MKEIRKLKPEEIDVRVGSTSSAKNKAMLLLYKDARCDMALLDEIFGVGNWQSKYTEIKGTLYCEVGVRASATTQGNETALPQTDWVWKQSNGVESQGTGSDDPNNQKGEASDAFKRACFMWGIGRELYEWKNIWIDYDKDKDKYEKYSVSKIEYDGNTPKTLIIVNSKGHQVYQYINGNFKATKTVSSETPSNNTPKQENVATSEISTPTRQFELSTEPDEDKTELVLENNRTILKELMLKVKEIGERNNQSFDEIKRVSKEGITNYFINVLKFPVADGKPTKFELSSVERKPLVKGNVVVVYNEEFIANFTQYILDNEFMPF